MLGKIESRRGRGKHRIRHLDGITNSMDMSLSRFLEIVKDREGWQVVVHKVTKNRTQLNIAVNIYHQTKYRLLLSITEMLLYMQKNVITGTSLVVQWLRL